MNLHPCPSDVHTEAVQAVLARHVERKVAVPMPSKRRSLVVQTSMDAYTPPGEDTHRDTPVLLRLRKMRRYELYLPHKVGKYSRLEHYRIIG